MFIARLGLLGAVLVLASGCAQFVAPSYTPEYEALERLKRAGIVKVTVGTVGPKAEDATVNRLSLRLTGLKAPRGTFADYLEDALVNDLKDISVYDPKSDARIDATILHNEIDVSGLSTGTGRMDVALVVTRGGQPRLSKTYSATTTFDSHLMANIAIPKGQAEYARLVSSLLAKVYGDADFVASLK